MRHLKDNPELSRWPEPICFLNFVSLVVMNFFCSKFTAYV